jgi:arylsulfatase B
MWQHVIDSTEPYGLGLEEKLLPEYLQEIGYTTNMIGKWHLGFYREIYTPTFRGFDSHYGYFTSRIDYWTYWHKQKVSCYQCFTLYLRRFSKHTYLTEFFG